MLVAAWCFVMEKLLSWSLVGKRLIEAGKSPDPAAVGDPAGDLKALLKA